MTASGASACTTSVSPTSSMDAIQGEAACARLFTTCSFAAGRWNRLSKRAKSCRISDDAGTCAPVPVDGDPAGGRSPAGRPFVPGR